MRIQNKVIGKLINPALLRAEKSARAAFKAHVRESDLLPEEVFCELLAFERKRAERSLKTMQLMLFDVSVVERPGERAALVRRLVQELDSVMGNIDVKGWYKDETVLGVFFPDVPSSEKERIQESLAGRLSSALITAGMRPLKPLFRSFPEKSEGDGIDTAGSLFYPEIALKEKKRGVALLIKRAMDIAGGCFGFLLFSPVFLVTPILIKATSKGPVLFKQERIGQYGRKFVFLKFRTMQADNDPRIHQEYVKKLIREQKSYEDDSGRPGVYKIKDDPRVTTIGRLLRKTSFDELPQFFNVLRGQMSLVGPRPPIPYELEDYDIWHLRRVMEVKPGITGLWQVGGRSSTTFDEMVRLDLKYSREWSIWMDIVILLKTPLAVIAGKGAY